MHVSPEQRQLALVAREVGMALAYIQVWDEGSRGKAATIGDLRQCVTRIQRIVIDGEPG